MLNVFIVNFLINSLDVVSEASAHRAVITKVTVNTATTLNSFKNHLFYLRAIRLASSISANFTASTLVVGEATCFGFLKAALTLRSAVLSHRVTISV